MLVEMFSFVLHSVCAKLKQDLRFHARLSKMKGDNQKYPARCFFISTCKENSVASDLTSLLFMRLTSLKRRLQETPFGLIISLCIE